MRALGPVPARTRHLIGDFGDALVVIPSLLGGEKGFPSVTIGDFRTTPFDIRVDRVGQLFVSNGDVPFSFVTELKSSP